MSESTNRSVECPLCGESFDPATAGGWCTNSECGEWQYDGEIESTDEEGGAPADEEDTADVTEDSLFGDDDTDEADDEGELDLDDPSEGQPELDLDEPAEESADEAADESEAAEEPETADESAADEPETADEPATADESDAAATADAESAAEPDVSESDSTVEPADTDADAGAAEATEEPDESDTLDACPACNTAVGPSDAFCPGCGEDLDAHRGADESEETLDACPSCGGDVEPSDAFCASCGEDLDAHRGEDESEDTLDACPSCGGDVEPSDAFCPGCGEDLDAHRGGDAGGEPSTPSTLALSAHGRSVVVGDDETVGRQIRSLLAEAGENEDQAVRIHREHVRFVREDGQFYVVDLGENPTAVNGVRMSKGDRKPIGPGDELTLSDVVTLDVERP